MAFPWGGSVTHQQLATKFGWPSVIISILLLPFLLLWSKLVAFPIWISIFWKSGPVYTTKTNYTYPQNDDAFRTFYTTRECVLRTPTGWNCYADVEGNKFFESFWGIIQVLDLRTHSDRMILSPNVLSWLSVSKVYVEFPQRRPVHENHLRFYFPLDGPNKYNPFTWMMILFGVTATTFFVSWSFVPYKEEHGLENDTVMYPPLVDSTKLRDDGSMVYEKSDKKSD